MSILIGQRPLQRLALGRLSTAGLYDRRHVGGRSGISQLPLKRIVAGLPFLRSGDLKRLRWLVRMMRAEPCQFIFDNGQ